MRRRRWGLLLASVAGGLMAGAARAAVIVNPDWVSKPTAAEVAYYYPRLPAVLGIEGRAWVHCEVTVQGAASHCAVVSESPAGLGFGDAALAMASSFRFTPRMIDGRPAEGGTVTVPIRFTPSAPAPQPAPPPPPSLADVEPRKAALARRLAALIDADELTPGPSSFARRMVAAIPVQGDPTDREKLVQAFETVLAKLRPEMAERRAALVAQAFTTDQLAATVAFFESDAGRAYRSGMPGVTRQLSADFATHRSAVIAEAIQAYCAQPGACPPPPPKDKN